jgi:adenylate kinase
VPTASSGYGEAGLRPAGAVAGQGREVEVLLLGPQGSGKGTQAKRIAADYEIPHIATGDIIRAMKEADTPLGRELKGVYDRGDLVPDDLMIRLIESRLVEDDTGNGFVLDGFPRTLPQAEALDELLRRLGRDLDVVFEFQVPDGDTLLQRILQRANEEKRSDDTPEAIRRRLALYYDQTEPLVEYYRSRHGNVVGIHAEKPIESVYREIQESLEQVDGHHS